MQEGEVPCQKELSSSNEELFPQPWQKYIFLNKPSVVLYLSKVTDVRPSEDTTFLISSRSIGVGVDEFMVELC